jgi:DNA-binding transcriptional LysR family regulator
MDSLTLDQFAIFVAIVDEGGFAAAARTMGRAQSAVTYAIRRLEEQSCTILFDRSTYRPRLTEAGRALLPHARRILTDVNRFRGQAQAMAGEVETELRLVVPDAMPPAPLMKALAALHARFPTVQVRIIIDTPATAIRQLRDGKIDIAIVLDMPGLPDWFRRLGCGHTPIVAVAAADHPLAKAKGAIPSEILADFLQIVFSSRSVQAGDPEYGVVAVNRWYVTDYATKHGLVNASIGWGGMPLHMVERDIANGTLVALTPENWDGAAKPPILTFVAGFNAERRCGPAAHTLLETLTSGSAG